LKNRESRRFGAPRKSRFFVFGAFIKLNKVVDCFYSIIEGLAKTL